MDTSAWINQFLAGLGAPATPQNIRAIDAWIRAEGTKARFNPLATTQRMPGSSGFNSNGGFPVQNYGDFNTGLQATLKTIQNGRYANILAALKAGQDATAVGQAIEASPWGTGGGVLRVLGAPSGQPYAAPSLSGGAAPDASYAGISTAPQTAGPTLASVAAAGRRGRIQKLMDSNAKLVGLSQPAYQMKPLDLVMKQIETRPTVGVDTTMTGAPTTGVDVSGGGDWGGALSVADQFKQMAASLGVGVMSAKRERQHTSSGGVSDHWTGSTNSYAYDLSNGNAPTPQMDALAAQIAARLGIPNWKGGVLNVNQGPFRIQLLYRTNVGGNHYNHVHVGVKRIA